MLKSIDILIGLSVVMLVVSMAVTLLTQFVISTLNTRGSHLMRGLRDLLQQLDPALSRKISKEISKKVLRHPLISDVGKRLGTVVHREEFIKMLLDLAAENGPQRLETDALNALKKAMETNGIADPKAALENIRSFTLALEKSNPDLANNVRLNTAIIHEASSQFVAKLHGWFDQTIDRVADRFTASTHAVTIVVALMVAFGIQLDALALVNRLSTDTALRQSLVQAATKVDQGQASRGVPSESSNEAAGVKSGEDQKGAAGKAQKQPATPNPATPPNDSAAKEGKQTPEGSTKPQGETGNKKDVAAQSPSESGKNPSMPDRVVSDVDAILGSTGLISAPDWNSFNVQKVLGIILSALLLSLGAPFWYDTLKTGLRLRAAIADKDDAQRLERQTTQVSEQQPSTAKAGLTSAGGALAGERGDLSAIG